MEKLLLTVAEAQKTLNVGRAKLYELLDSGEIPSIRLGRSVRIPARALEQWLDDLYAKQANTKKAGQGNGEGDLYKYEMECGHTVASYTSEDL